LPEVKLGIIPAAGATQTVPRAIGRSRALDMMISGDWINAHTALKYGLVNRVVRMDELQSTVEKIAHRIARHEVSAVRDVKQAINRGIDQPLQQGLEKEYILARSLPS